jgi:hypothetical protein
VIAGTGAVDASQRVAGVLLCGALDPHGSPAISSRPESGPGKMGLPALPAWGLWQPCRAVPPRYRSSDAGAAGSSEIAEGGEDRCAL